MKALRIAVIVLVLATAVVHLYLFWMGLARGRLSWVQYGFLVNGISYLVLLGGLLLALPAREPLPQVAHYLLMAFAAGSIAAWVVINRGRFLLDLSVFDKAVEVLLIVALALHLRLVPRRSQATT